jgi:S-DNA-T family DNA segregation ATPase FtsK/SpoIIIE
MVAEGRPGFTLVRTPRTEDQIAERIAADTAHLVSDPLALIEYQTRGLHAVDDEPAA